MRGTARKSAVGGLRERRGSRTRGERYWALAAALGSAAAHAGVRPAHGGDLRVVVPALPGSLDPVQAATASDLAVARALYEPLVFVGPQGAIVPNLLEAPPEPVPGANAVRLRLRPGLADHQGNAVDAGSVAASLARIGVADPSSPYAALLLPVAAIAPAGELEVRVQLAFPYPDWAIGLAHPGVGVVGRGFPGRAAGTGPFRVSRAPAPGSPGERRGDEPGRGIGFDAFADAPAGRPFADRLLVSAADARGAARALLLGTADAALVPVPGIAAADGPMLVATYLALNPDRLGGASAWVRAELKQAVDAADLTQYFVRTPAVPMTGLLPPALEAGPAGPSASPQGPNELGPSRGSPGPARATLFVDAANADHRSVAERIQVLLHDRGIALVVRSIPRGDFRRLLSRRDYDLAVVSLPALPEPGLALAQVLSFAVGPGAAAAELAAIGKLADAPARRLQAVARARALRDSVPLVPLYAGGVRLSLRSGVLGGGYEASGAPLLADVWLWEAK